jgi:hypothetical protein
MTYAPDTQQRSRPCERRPLTHHVPLVTVAAMFLNILSVVALAPSCASCGCVSLFNEFRMINKSHAVTYCAYKKNGYQEDEIPFYVAVVVAHLFDICSSLIAPP